MPIQVRQQQQSTWYKQIKDDASTYAGYNAATLAVIPKLPFKREDQLGTVVLFVGEVTSRQQHLIHVATAMGQVEQLLPGRPVVADVVSGGHNQGPPVLVLERQPELLAPAVVALHPFLVRGLVLNALEERLPLGVPLRLRARRRINVAGGGLLAPQQLALVHGHEVRDVVRQLRVHVCVEGVLREPRELGVVAALAEHVDDAHDAARRVVAAAQEPQLRVAERRAEVEKLRGRVGPQDGEDHAVVRQRCRLRTRKLPNGVLVVLPVHDDAAALTIRKPGDTTVRVVFGGRNDGDVGGGHDDARSISI
jgi:hypothetical protein